MEQQKDSVAVFPRQRVMISLETALIEYCMVSKKYYIHPRLGHKLQGVLPNIMLA